MWLLQGFDPHFMLVTAGSPSLGQLAKTRAPNNRHPPPFLWGVCLSRGQGPYLCAPVPSHKTFSVFTLVYAALLGKKHSTFTHIICVPCKAEPCLLCKCNQPSPCFCSWVFLVFCVPESCCNLYGGHRKVKLLFFLQNRVLQQGMAREVGTSPSTMPR